MLAGEDLGGFGARAEREHVREVERLHTDAGARRRSRAERDEDVERQATLVVHRVRRHLDTIGERGAQPRAAVRQRVARYLLVRIQNADERLIVSQGVGAHVAESRVIRLVALEARRQALAGSQVVREHAAVRLIANAGVVHALVVGERDVAERAGRRAVVVRLAVGA